MELKAIWGMPVQCIRGARLGAAEAAGEGGKEKDIWRHAPGGSIQLGAAGGGESPAARGNSRQTGVRFEAEEGSARGWRGWQHRARAQPAQQKGRQVIGAHSNAALSKRTVV